MRLCPSASENGFTLIEMVVVLVVLSVVTHLALRELSRARDRRLEAAADRQLETLRDCVFAYDREGVPTGFLADMGRLVSTNGTEGTLAELWRMPADAKPYSVLPAVGANVVPNLRHNADFTNAVVRVPTGWRGAYLRLPVGRTELLDPWGNPIAVRDDAGFARLGLTNGSYVVSVSHCGATALERNRRTLSLVPDGGATSRLTVLLRPKGEVEYGSRAVAWYGPCDGLVTGAVTRVACGPSTGSVAVEFAGLTPGVRVLREDFTKTVRLVTVRPGANEVEVVLP